jgi:sugar phosphate permease
VNAASGRAVLGWFEQRQRGFALGIRQTAVPLGGTLAALALPPIAGGWGVRGGLIALALGCFVTAGGGVVGLREAPGEEEELDDLVHPLKDERVWRLSIGSGLILGAQACILGFAVLFLHGERGLSTGEAGAVLAATQVVGGFLRIAAGRWSDHVRARLRPLRQLATALAVSLVVTAILTNAPLTVLLPALAIAGALSLSWNGLSFTATAEIAGRARAGAAIGLQQSFLAVGSIVTPIAFAAVVHASSWRTAFVLSALSPLAGCAVLRGVPDQVSRVDRSFQTGYRQGRRP